MTKLCNKCGESLKNLSIIEDNANFGLVDASFTTGYYSPVLPDCKKYIFSMCEKCIVELFDSFIIPPETYEISCFDCEPLEKVEYVSVHKFWL